MAQNDGGIKRGDRAETGDLAARKKDGVGREGSGVPGGDGGASGNVTAAADSLEEPVGGTWIGSEDAILQAEDLENFQISDANDGSFGLTNVPGRRPAEDWAAETGPAHDAEEQDEIQKPREPKLRSEKRSDTVKGARGQDPA